MIIDERVEDLDSKEARTSSSGEARVWIAVQQHNRSEGVDSSTGYIRAMREEEGEKRGRPVSLHSDIDNYPGLANASEEFTSAAIRERKMRRTWALQRVYRP